MPPTKNSKEALDFIVNELTRDPPYNAIVKVTPLISGNGWNALTLPKSQMDVIQEASRNFYGSDALFYGLGGSIPLVSDL